MKRILGALAAAAFLFAAAPQSANACGEAKTAKKSKKSTKKVAKKKASKTNKTVAKR